MKIAAQAPRMVVHRADAGRLSGRSRRLVGGVPRGQIRSLSMTLAGLLLGIAGWSFLSHFIVNPYLVPPPLAVAKAMIPMIRSGELWDHIAASFLRIAVGF